MTKMEGRGSKRSEGDEKGKTRYREEGRGIDAEQW